VEPFLRDAIFRAAVEAADHHLLFTHMATFGFSSFPADIPSLTRRW
jgi:hypothetical protein